ncbi:MAG: hypothetical protein D6711_13665 [Chloroflexi bacterium]|nr:MAG: hypothetical protein D6711_13665 [Chloroflexota bacterium]
MLIRTYRVTDKIGVAILKTGAGLSAAALERATILIGSPREGSGLFGMLRAIILGLFAFVLLLFRLMHQILSHLLTILRTSVKWLLVLFNRIASIAGARGLQIGKTARTAAKTAASNSMARRSARAEMEVGIVEDPLRVQNRLLSALVVIILAVLVFVVLWTTSNTGTKPTTPIINNPNLNLPVDDASLEQVDAATPVSLIVATPVPTATDIPAVLQAGGSMIYTQRELGQTDIWAVPVGGREPIRLISSPEDDRDPAWSPNGTQIAYASREQDSNWDLYVYDIPSNSTTRLTYNLAFEAGPTWSPDGVFLAYEGYQRSTHLDIFVVRADASEPAIRLPGSSDTADFSPAWSPLPGRRIAFVSWRDGNQDIYVYNLDTNETINITNTPNRHEDYPAWSPDGQFLAYSAMDAGQEKVFVQNMNDLNQEPEVFRVGREPVWSPDGRSIAYAIDSPDNQTTFITVAPFIEGVVTSEVIQTTFGANDPDWSGTPLPPTLLNSGGVPLAVEGPLYIEQFDPPTGDPPYGPQPILNVEGPVPALLHERVNDSFNALREAANEKIGWDFLGELTYALWQLDHRREQGEPARNWHLTGRAFSFNRNQGGFPADFEVVRVDDASGNTYWHTYVRVAEEAQNGQLGEPLRRMPWDFASRDSGDLEAYNQGGRPRSVIPEGYYVNFTQLAADYGWQPMPAGSDWRNNFNVRNYWMYVKPEGLTWYEAMRELYTVDQLGGFNPTPTPPPIIVTPTEEEGS